MRETSSLYSKRSRAKSKFQLFQLSTEATYTLQSPMYLPFTPIWPTSLAMQQFNDNYCSCYHFLCPPKSLINQTKHTQTNNDLINLICNPHHLHPHTSIKINGERETNMTLASSISVSDLLTFRLTMTMTSPPSRRKQSLSYSYFQQKFTW